MLKYGYLGQREGGVAESLPQLVEVDREVGGHTEVVSLRLDKKGELQIL